jgi:hypothetical protein
MSLHHSTTAIWTHTFSDLGKHRDLSIHKTRSALNNQPSLVPPTQDFFKIPDLGLLTTKAPISAYVQPREWKIMV